MHYMFMFMLVRPGAEELVGFNRDLLDAAAIEVDLGMQLCQAGQAVLYLELKSETERINQVKCHCKLAV